MASSSNVAVITGGARGIGYAAAQRLARNGASIAIIDLDPASAERAAGRIASEYKVKALGLGADVSERENVSAAHQAVAERLGPPSVLVNSAAVTDDKLFLESTREDWNKIFSVGLFGALNCLREFLPGMVERQYGRVIFLASDSYKLGQARLSYYAAAKGAVVALAKSVAQEVGASGVTINVVSPGATNTEMRREREANLLAQMGPEKYERRQQSVLKMYPTRRLGEPDDIAAAIAFLAGDDASWITGQVLSVNGGFTMA